MRVAALLLVLVGCGRVGFDPLGTGGGDDDGTGDGGAGDDGGGGGGDATVDVGPVTFVGGAHAEQMGMAGQVNPTVNAAIQTGDAIIVSVGWHDGTSTLASVSDSLGTTYVVTVGVSHQTSVSQMIYTGFAPANASFVTVNAQFNGQAFSPSGRVAMYRGVDSSNALQGGNGGGTNSTAMAGVGFVAGANWRVVMTNTSSVAVAGIDAGWTQRITTNFSEVVFDQSFATSGIKTGNATLVSAGDWVMQTVQLPPM